MRYIFFVIQGSNSQAKSSFLSGQQCLRQRSTKNGISQVVALKQVCHLDRLGVYNLDSSLYNEDYGIGLGKAQQTAPH